MGKSEKATFAAGCFWGVEEALRKIKGVKDTVVGYMGGVVKNPTYKQVCTGATGHKEVCQVEFDPEVISYEELLEHFWKFHDPTQMGRQGPDIGEQYSSIIFYHNDKQKAIAMKSKQNAQNSFRRKIVTKIEPAKAFYKAEEYHQRYLEKNHLKGCGF